MEGVAVVLLAAEVPGPGLAEVVHFHISTCDYLIPVMGTAFQIHIDSMSALNRRAGEEVMGARHLREETVDVVSEAEVGAAHLEQESSEQSLTVWRRARVVVEAQEAVLEWLEDGPEVVVGLLPWR